MGILSWFVSEDEKEEKVYDENGEIKVEESVKTQDVVFFKINGYNKKSQEILNYLRNYHVLLLEFSKEMTDLDRQRYIDFLYGSTRMVGSKIKNLSDDIYIIFSKETNFKEEDIRERSE